MQKLLFILLAYFCGQTTVGQTVLKGNLGNYYNKYFAVKIIADKKDSTWNVSTNRNGDFLINFRQPSPFEGHIFLGKQKISFFSAPPDTVILCGDYKRLKATLQVNNKRGFTKPAKLHILNGANIDSISALLPSLKNKVTLIETWATWCGPCIVQQKMIAEYKSHYNGLGLDFLYISMDKEQHKEKWQRYIQTNKLEGDHLLANDKLWNDIVVNNKYNEMPTYLIIDKEGIVHKYNPVYLKEQEAIYPMFKRQIAELFSTIDTYLK
jgi:thiol-disulfide isomerase/thioredoxin